jgi:uncharacterized protein (TIGR02246 family)
VRNTDGKEAPKGSILTIAFELWAGLTVLGGIAGNEGKRYAVRMRLFAIVLAVAGLAVAAEKSAEGVKSAEKSWATATVAGDEESLRQVLADDLTYTHSTGETDNKTQFISNLKTGVRKYVKVNHESMDVRIYGNTAVLMATAQIETTQNGGAPNPAHLRWIHVWVNGNGRWRLVAHQSLRLPK